MATIQQIEANRLNSQKSTGPRSAEGKAASSMNALKSGIDAKSEVIRGEDTAALQALAEEYLARFQPATPEQRHYVDTLIRDDWQLRRLAKADAQVWEYEMQSAWKLNETCSVGQAFRRGDTTFARLQRRIDATQRSYRHALHELERLQSTGPAPGPPPQPIEMPLPSHEIGFVPVAQASACEPAPPAEIHRQDSTATVPHDPPQATPSMLPCAPKPTSPADCR